MRVGFTSNYNDMCGGMVDAILELIELHILFGDAALVCECVPGYCVCVCVCVCVGAGDCAAAVRP